MTPEQALELGYDRQGPDIGVDWTDKPGFACTCYWSSRNHGDRCPEHGKIGTPIGKERRHDGA